MALIRNNNEYLKIDYANCYMDNMNNVQVPIIYYKDISHRIFEKENADKIYKFIKNGNEYIDELDKSLNDYLKVLCPNAEEFDDYSKYYFILENDQLLNEKLTILNSISEEFDYIQSVLNGDFPHNKIISNVELFKSLGFEENWLENPIIITRKAVINVGKINEQNFGGETIYPLLKEKMPNTIDDL